jgi:hypothetical protein
VITERDHVCAFQQFFGTAERDTAAGSRIFTIDHGELSVEFSSQFRQESFDGISAAFTNNVAKKDQGHFQ